jgi:type III pantothenate kinase
MLLCIDIGNTGIHIGAFKGDELLLTWRLSTDKERSSDEYGITLRDLLEHESVSDKFKGVIVSCVVPSLEDVFNNAIRKYIGLKPIFIAPGIKTGMPILTDNPKEVGPDRIVSALAAFDKFKTALIVVDFGTAVTFDYVTKEGEYAGGLIAPGIDISSDALFTKAARLSRVQVAAPKKVVGKNTKECLQAGIYYGFAGLVDGIIDRITKEVKTKPKVIATGGQSGLIAKASSKIDECDETLILKGLKIVYGLNT